MTYYYWETQVIKLGKLQTQVVAVKCNSKKEAKEIFNRRAGKSVKDSLGDIINSECLELSSGMSEICNVLLSRYPLDCSNGKEGRFFRFTPSFLILILTSDTKPKIEAIDASFFE